MLNVEEITRKENKKKSGVHFTILQQIPASTKNIPLIQQYPFYQLYLQYSQSVQKQFVQLKDYLNELQQKIQNVKEDQIDCLSLKHRYYIRKFRKYSQQQQKLLEHFQSLQNIILKSPPVQQEITSINFIQMVSEETQNKLQNLKEVVQKAQAKKAENQLNIKNLRQKLIEYKKIYFQKKREQAALLKEIQQNKKKKCMQHIDKIMKKIRHQKKQKLEQMRKSFNHVVQISISDKFKMSGLSYRAYQKKQTANFALQQLKKKSQQGKASQMMKKSITLSNFAKKSKMQTNHHESQCQQKNSNKQMLPSSTNSNKAYTSNNTSLLTNEQILKKLNKKQNLSLKQKFREQTSQNVLRMLIQYGKINELMTFIDQDKIPSLLQYSDSIFLQQQQNNKYKIGQYI